METVIPKLVTTPRAVLSMLRNQTRKILCPSQTSKVTVLYRHTKSENRFRKTHEKLKKGHEKFHEVPRTMREWPSLWPHKSKNIQLRSPFSRSKQYSEYPELSKIINLLKTQPNFNWRTLFRSESKANLLAWPMFNRSMQFVKPGELDIKTLIKNRLNAHNHSLSNEKDLEEVQDQKYLPQRVRAVGPDLAAIHFFVERRASVRLTGQSYWIVGGAPKFTAKDQLNQCMHGGFSDEELYISNCNIEAIDCSNFQRNGIRYEGLQYLSGLKHLKWLSLKNQKNIDVWCLERIASLVGTTLEYLDISQCKLDVGCISAVARIQTLKTLVIKDPGFNVPVQHAITCLVNMNPKLTVRSINAKYEPLQKTASKSSKMCATTSCK